jgi:hypothetical protein
MANEHITIGSNSYDKLSLLTNQNSSQEEIKFKKFVLFRPNTFVLSTSFKNFKIRLLRMLLISTFLDLWTSFCRLHPLDPQLPPLAPNILFSFSNHQGALLFFLLSLLSYVFQWHHEGGNFFSEYDQFNWLFYALYFFIVLFSLNVRYKVSQPYSTTSNIYYCFIYFLLSYRREENI